MAPMAETCKPRVLRGVAVSASADHASFCETETFHATCALDEVIVMTRAHYGRMRISRCVKLDYGHLGCEADVLELADARCSGRRRCEIRIPDPEFAKNKPCPEDLKPYFEASYECVKGTDEIHLQYSTLLMHVYFKLSQCINISYDHLTLS